MVATLRSQGEEAALLVTSGQCNEGSNPCVWRPEARPMHLAHVVGRELEMKATSPDLDKPGTIL